MLNHRNTNVFFISVLLFIVLLQFFVTLELGIYIIVLVVLWFSIAFWGSSFIASNYHVKTFCNNPLETERKMALTFDDGPSEMTPAILDLLKENNLKATFFCIGKNCEKYPEILKRISNEGHIIGNHTFNHSHFFDFFGKDKVLDEIRKTDAIIEKITSKKPDFFRPPYGVTNPSIRRALTVTKHKVIGWNIRSLDGILKNEKIIFARIKKRLSPGSVVLLHDTSMESVRVLEQLLLTLKQNNYEVVALEALLNKETYEN